MTSLLTWLLVLSPLLPLGALILMLFKKEKTRADFWLMTWLFFMLVGSFLNIIDLFGWYGSVSFIIGLSQHLLIEDFFIFSVYGFCLLNNRKKVPLKHLLVAGFPVLLSIPLFIVQFYSLPEAEKVSKMTAIMQGQEPLWLSVYAAISIFLIMGLIITQLIIVSKLLYQRRKKSLPNLRNYKLFLSTLLVVYSILAFSRTLRPNGEEQNVLLYLLFFSLLLITFCVVAFLGFRQRNIFPELEVGESVIQNKHRTTYQKLCVMMQEQKLYLADDLTINQAAQAIKESPRHVSESLRKNYIDNFSNYVNHFRVKEVKRLLCNESYHHWSLLAIAHEAGFSSKATFNRAFKRAEGMTPSAYRKKYHSS